MNVLIGILLTIPTIFLTLLLIYYYNFFWMRLKMKNIPYVKQYPIIGSTLTYPNTIALYKNLLEFPRTLGRTYWVMVGPIPVLLVSDPDLLEIVLSSPKHIDKPPFYKIVKKLGQNGLIASNGDIWRSQRKMLTPTFHFKILEQFLKIFNRRAEEFVEELKSEVGKPETDLPMLTAQWALNQLTETVMGLKSEENRSNNAMYLEHGKKLLLIATQRLIRPLEYFDLTYYFTRNYWNELRHTKKLDDYVLATIRKKTAEMETNQSKTVIIEGKKQKIVSLDMLLEYSKTDFELSEYVLKDQVHTLMFAGYDTTAATVAYALYNLAEHPDVQRRVHQEVLEVMNGDPSTEITLPLLQEMKYLDMFVKESMRRYTHVPIIGRELGEDVKWGDAVLPKGLTVVPALLSLHMDPELYPEPERFEPERFSAEAARARHPYAFVPFSAGPRNCLGQKYASYAVRLGLAKLVARYEFASVGHRLDLSAEVALISKTGVRVGIRERKLEREGEWGRNER